MPGVLPVAYAFQKFPSCGKNFHTRNGSMVSFIDLSRHPLVILLFSKILLPVYSQPCVRICVHKIKGITVKNSQKSYPGEKVDALHNYGVLIESVPRNLGSI